LSRQRKKDDNHFKGLTVEVKNGDFNKALRTFKRKVSQDGVLQELRERQHYIKPSERRKKAKAAGRARWLKEVRRKEREFGY
jgi:small subunit ribosomal protein S21